MHWGEAQSVLQLTIGLNVAYFSFREIRTPVLARYVNSVAAAEKAITDGMAVFGVVRKPERVTGFDEASSFFIKRDVFEGRMSMYSSNLHLVRSPFEENFYVFDKTFRTSALLMALIGFVLLVVSSLYAESKINVAFFLITTGIQLMPILGSVAYNWFMVSMVEQQMSYVANIQREAKQLSDEFARDYLPRYEVFLKRQQAARIETPLQPNVQKS